MKIDLKKEFFDLFFHSISPLGFSNNLLKIQQRWKCVYTRSHICNIYSTSGNCIYSREMCSSVSRKSYVYLIIFPSPSPFSLSYSRSTMGFMFNFYNFLLVNSFLFWVDLADIEHHAKWKFASSSFSGKDIHTLNMYKIFLLPDLCLISVLSKKQTSLLWYARDNIGDDAIKLKGSLLIFK